MTATASGACCAETSTDSGVCCAQTNTGCAGQDHAAAEPGACCAQTKTGCADQDKAAAARRPWADQDQATVPRRPRPERARVGFLHAGSFYHLAGLRDPALEARDLADLYAPEVGPESFKDVDALFVACRQHPAVMRRVAPFVVDFLDRPGARVVVGGENRIAEWLPGAAEEPRETNFWAWRTGEDTTRRTANPDHELWDYLTEGSVHWHHHGGLTVPPGATPLVTLDEGLDPPKAIIYHDPASFKAELVAMTMDPTYHHGCGFMPGATQLVYRLLDWLANAPARAAA
jgi:hypothetical protein